jgi:NAD(P)-dependent dehydrogenase (short-subunit alcohol dehydrogenase family)
MKLNGKIALITGGTTGIGFATAELFQKEGATVIVTGKNPANLETAQKALGPKAVVISADAASPADSEKVAAEIKQRFGKLDIAFLNAGIAEFAPLADSNEAFFDRMFAINVKGPYFQVQKLLPLLGKGSSVIFNSSVVNTKGMPTTSVYAATKAAVRAFGRTLAGELVGAGIRVNTVSPGPIATPIYGKLGMPAEAAKGFEEQMASSNPMKRFGQPDEIAKTVLFLASDDSSYITGSDIYVDGGMTQL